MHDSSRIKVLLDQPDKLSYPCGETAAGKRE
jgi:hypothetical protein